MVKPVTDVLGKLMPSGGEDPNVREAVETLRAVPLFRDYPRAYLRDFAHALHYRDYRPNDYVYYEGDPGLGLYIVQRGAVRLVVDADEEGEETEVGRVRENGFFGVNALFGDVRRQETAQAVTETRMLGFFRPDLNSLIKRHPKSGAAVMLAFAQYVVAHDLEALQLLVARAGRATAHQALHQALADDKRTGVVTPLSF